MVTSVLRHQGGQAGHYEGSRDCVEAEAEVELGDVLAVTDDDEAGHDEEEASHGCLLLPAERDPADDPSLQDRHDHPNKQEHPALQMLVSD